MEFRHVKYFVALARIQHFKKAADELNITQPSLSKSLQKLEAHVGGELIVRSSKGMVITDFGCMVLVHCQNIMKQYDTLKRDIAVSHADIKQEIKVGASPIPSSCLVGPILGEFMQACPNMTIDLKVDNWRSLTGLLLEDKLDLFIAETGATKLESNPLLRLLALPPFPVIFCCRPEHPLANRERLYLASFREFPMAIPQHLPDSVRNQFEELFQLDRDDFSGQIRFDQLHSIKDSICQTDLIALTPEIAVQSELVAGTLVKLVPELMPKLNARFSIVSLVERKESQLIQVFMEFVMRRARFIKGASPMDMYAR